MANGVKGYCEVDPLLSFVQSLGSKWKVSGDSFFELEKKVFGVGE